MKNNLLRTFLRFIYYAICGYLVGLLIYFISPTGSSENAPISCLSGALTFLVFKDYLIPYFRKVRP